MILYLRPKMFDKMITMLYRQTYLKRVLQIDSQNGVLDLSDDTIKKELQIFT